VRIVVVCVGRAKGAPFADDLAHYERLLSRHARIEVREVREAGLGSERRAEALEREAGAVLRQVPEASFLCVLDREGDPRSSTEIAAFLEQRRGSGRDLCLVIGGAFGLAARVIDAADARLSLGPITLPHELARVVLLEQLFRAHKILAREPYHY
jgi:23S rRNA (pseudouridine1915-N3)-methyltransferase